MTLKPVHDWRAALPVERAGAGGQSPVTGPARRPEIRCSPTLYGSFVGVGLGGRTPGVIARGSPLLRYSVVPVGVRSRSVPQSDHSGGVEEPEADTGYRPDVDGVIGEAAVLEDTTSASLGARSRHALSGCPTRWCQRRHSRRRTRAGQPRPGRLPRTGAATASTALDLEFGQVLGGLGDTLQLVNTEP